MRTVIVIDGETMGRGAEELGRTLIGAFLRKLAASPEKPEQIILYNAGVKLAADGSTVLDAISHLAGAGVDVVACGTCVDFFGLRGAMRAGRIGSMDGIVADLMGAEKVVTI
jgi:selenium metabolism protein YedF